VENGVRNASILGLGGIKVVGCSVGLDGDIFQECVHVDGAVNVGLGLFREVDGLGVATTFKVKDTVIVPAVLVVANQGAVGIGREGRLARSRQTKKERDVSLLSDIGGAVHGEVTHHGQPVVHEAENSLFVLTTIPGSENDGLLFLYVKDDGRFTVQIVLDPVVVDLTAAVDDGKVGLESLKFRGRFGANEHVCHCVYVDGME